MINQRKTAIYKDLGIICLSILIAVILAKTGAIKELLTATKEAEIIGSFLAGIFFTSMFTTAPATVALAEIAQSNSILLVAIFGGLGALLGDLIIFRFIKDHISEDITYLINKSKSKRLVSVFHLRSFKWLVPFLGALVVASPLPDEIGLTMMGLSKMKMALFVPLSFLLNSAGILIIGLIAKMLQ
jgi:hypothetical protein